MPRSVSAISRSEVFLHCQMPAGEFVLERGKSHAEADVGLDHPVMEVTGDALAFQIGGVGGEPVHEADVFNRRHGVFEHLQEEGHVRGSKARHRAAVRYSRPSGSPR